MVKINAIIYLTLLITPFIYGQNGTLTGKIFDKSSGEELIGSTIFVQNTQTGTISDIDGTYSLELPPGRYTIVCSYVSYKNIEVSDIEIKSKAVINQDIGMVSDAMGLEEVVITTRQVTHTENALLIFQKKTTSVINAISTQEISRNGDRQAADAIQRVSGISVEGGKYVYVRGLSDRYSMTTLNRAEIPGLDPNRNTVQMDLFPSNIINNIVVHKTFSPELPGSFAGGYVNIETKDFPNHFTLRFSTALGYNANSNLRKDFLNYKGGKYDFLAIDDGTRSWPVSSDAIPYLYEDNERLDQITRSFNKEMDVSAKTSFLNHSHAISLGDQIKFGTKSLGYMASISYQRNFEAYNDGEMGRYKLTGADEKNLNTERELTVHHGEEVALIGAMLSLNYKFSPNHKIGIVGIHNRSGNKTTRYFDGIRPTDEIGSYQQTRELNYLQRSVSSVQLKGSHYIASSKKINIKWLSTFTKANQSTPDLRYFTNSYFVESEDTLYSIEKSKYALPARFTRNMNEYNLDNKVDFVLPFTYKDNDSRLKFGFSNVFKRRIFLEQRIDINSQNNSYNGSIEEYLSDNNIGQAGEGTYGVYVQDASELRNNYTGYQNVFSAYSLVDLSAGEQLKAQLGARMEMANIFIQSYDPERPDGSLNNLDILPALNINYEFVKDMNLRFAATRTIARPTFRELAPYASFDYATGETKIGNEALKRTLITNFDLRWETFLNPGEIISVSGFYKRFTNPIEVTFNPVAANPELSWKNIEKASLYGVEFEFRKQLDFISALKDLKVGANLTLVKSLVSIDSLELVAIRGTDPSHPDTRVMFGQAPYVINSFLGYANKSLGIDANLTYNMTAQKLAVVIVSGTPNVYEQPFHSLNFNIGKKIREQFYVRFSVKNILNDSFRKTYFYNNIEYIYNKFRPGRTFSFGFTYSIK